MRKKTIKRLLCFAVILLMLQGVLAYAGGELAEPAATDDISKDYIRPALVPAGAVACAAALGITAGMLRIFRAHRKREAWKEAERYFE